MKIGIFGGTFDPVHLGHVHLAREMKKVLELDRVIVVVANLSPFKIAIPPHVEAQKRLEMVKLAFEGLPGFEISSIEIDRGGASYTIDTVKVLRKTHEKDELYLLLSQENLAFFDSWKDSKNILSYVNVAFGVDQRQNERQAKANIYPIPWVDISSTEIRKKLFEREDCKSFLPLKVVDYIRKHQLYLRTYDN